MGRFNGCKFYHSLSVLDILIGPVDNDRPQVGASRQA